MHTHTHTHTHTHKHTQGVWVGDEGGGDDSARSQDGLHAVMTGSRGEIARVRGRVDAGRDLTPDLRHSCAPPPFLCVYVCILHVS